MKILIAKNKGVSSRKVSDIKKYINREIEDFIDDGWIEELDIDFDEIDVDFEVEHKFYAENSKGERAYGSKNAKDYFRNTVERNTYDAVFHVYDNKFYPKDGYVAPFTTFSGVFYETEYVELPDNKGNKYTPVHELMHVIGNLLEKLGYIKKIDDQMDRTLVDGVWIPYYKNSYPNADGGNYHVTLTNYKPYLKYVSDLRLKQDIVVPQIIDTSSYRPKYFNIKELVPANIYSAFGDTAWQFLDRRVIMNLDYIREKIGKPILVNYGRLNYRGYDDGGYRNNNSQHKHGRAIDFDVIGMSAQQVRDWIVKNYKNFPEPNIWIEDDVTWVHMDVRYSDKKGIYLFKP